MLVKNLRKTDLNKPVQLIIVEGAADYQGTIGYLTEGPEKNSFGFKPFVRKTTRKEYDWIPLSEHDELEFLR